MHVEKIHNKLIEKCLNKSIKFGTYLAILFTVQIAYTKTNRLFLKPNPIYKEDSTSFYKEDAYVLMSGNAVKRSHSLFSKHPILGYHLSGERWRALAKKLCHKINDFYW